MNRLLAALAVVTGLFGPTVGSVRADVTAEQVRKAIDRGVSYLLSQQLNSGGWTDGLGQPGGISALCTLALLNAGVDPGEEKMQKSLSHLRRVKPDWTYVVSLQTMVFARASPELDRVLIGRNVKWLENTQIAEGPSKGAWSYPGRGAGDNSNAQFALLALYEAERVGVSASDRTWGLAKRYWEKCQNPDGSWGYTIRNSFRHRQHDLRRHHLADHRRGYGAGERRPGDGRPCRVLSRPQPPRRRPHRAGHQLAGAKLLRRP